MKKIVIGICMVLAMTGESFAGCVEGDCVNGQGTYEWADGDFLD